MHCPHCGKEVIPSARFCHHCGHKLPTRQKTSSDTKDVLPVDEEMLDGPASIERAMEETHDLVELIEQVDQRINDDLSRHDALDTEEDPDFIGPKQVENAAPKPRQHTKPFTPIEEVVVAEEKAQTVEPRPTREAKEDAPRRGLKKLWHDFIHEEDDEFSIFEALKGQPEPKMPRAQEAVITQEPPILAGPSAPEESLDFTQDSALLRAMLDEKTPSEKKKTSEKTHLAPEETTIFRSLKKEVNERLAEEEKKEAAKASSDLETSKTFEKVEHSDKPVERNKKSSKKSTARDKKFSFPSFKRPKKEKPKAKTIEKSVVDTVTEDALKSTPSEEKDVAKGSDLLLRLSHPPKSIEKILAPCDKILQRPTTRLVLRVAAIGLILCLLPPAIGAPRANIFLASVFVGKAILSFLPFFIAERSVVGQVPLDHEPRLWAAYSVMLWSILQGFYLITYGIHSAIAGLSLFPAVTAPMWASLLSFVLTPLLALYFHRRELTSVRKRQDFFGWYLIFFVVSHLFVKLFWFLMNLVHNIF